MTHVAGWEPRFIGLGADGFFKIILRRHPTLVCWSWAVEWNHNYRVIGLAGPEPDLTQSKPEFPPLEVTTLRPAPGVTLRMRDEVELPEVEDVLFHWPGDESLDEGPVGGAHESRTPTSE